MTFPQNLLNMSIDIDTLLKEKKLSKTDIAKKMGLSRESLYRILSGNPTLDNIIKLANALGVSVSELFTKGENELSGYVEYQGTIYRISSFEDLEKLLELK